MNLFGRKTPPSAPPKPAETPESAREDTVPASPLSPTAPSPAGLSPAALSPTAPASAVAAVPQPAPFGAPSPAARAPFSDKGSEMNTTPPKPPVGSTYPGSTFPGPASSGPTSPAASFKPSDIPRRTVDLPGAQRKPEGYAIPGAVTPAPAPAPVVAAPAPAPVTPEQRRLIVGRDISLSGEIGSCDMLVVEGSVEARLRDGRSIEITESGLFKGSVEIDEADIGGRFEGDLTVRGRLTVRSTGKITGAIKYGELTVESGGRLIGDVQVYGTTKPAAPAAPSAPALADA